MVNSVKSTGTEYYRPHEEQGAEIIADFLRQQNVDAHFIERVKNKFLGLVVYM